MEEYPMKDKKGLEKLERQAMKRRWNIPPEKMKAMIDRQCDIATDRMTPNRESTAAFNAILAAESQNQKDEHKIVDVSISARNDELSKIASDLGIDPSLIADGPRSPVSSVEGAECITEPE